MNSRLLASLIAAALIWGTFAGIPRLGAKGRPPASARIVRTFGKQAADPVYNTHRFLLSPEVVMDSTDGTLRLAHSVLVADEMGATDYRQAVSLTARTWAKKTFVLDSADATSAEFFIFGSAQTIHLNGNRLEPSRNLVSTGWTRTRVPPALLKKGKNEFVLSGGGSLLLEPGRQPARSFKSNDAGKTWSNRTLGARNNQQGEYVVRLRLGRYAKRGWAKSSVFDLWSQTGGMIAVPGKIVQISSLEDLRKKQPAGTRLTPWLRTGSTPTPEENSWTSWLRLEKSYRPAEKTAGHRWAQLKFSLTTENAQATPRLPARFQFAFDFQADPEVSKDALRLVPAAKTSAQKEIALSSVPFVYQAPSPRLKLLRQRYQLDKVIAPGKTEMEQLMLLRHWVRNQWHTAWGSNAAAWMPPWDALIILSSKDQDDCLTMCTHYAAVFTQCCLALGWTARHCIVDHHCTAEVWVGQHNKWVMMDAGNSAERADCTLHFERKGVPLSALELHLADKTRQTGDITVHFSPAKLMQKISPLCRPAPASKVKPPVRPDVIVIADLPKYPVCGLNNYRRYAFPARNNYLDSLYPGELYQGWSEYYYDGYCWVGDSPDAPTISPEYSRHVTPARAQDIDWTVSWTRIHLARSAKAGEIQVDLETSIPNLARLEMTENAGKVAARGWKPAASRFLWKLKPGDNLLRVRSVNQFERRGSEAQVLLKWAPTKR
jgi:hypothetical protein